MDRFLASDNSGGRDSEYELRKLDQAQIKPSTWLTFTTLAVLLIALAFMFPFIFFTR